VSSNKCVTIMAFKQNQLQVTTQYPQANAIIERVYQAVNDMLRSFDLENNHENLGEQEDNPFDCCLLLLIIFMVANLLEAPIIQHCRKQHHTNLCLAEI
jgi:hypothetical protein